MVDFADEEISLERLAGNYYEGLRLLAGEGLYGNIGGSEFTFRHGNGLVLATFDPFSTSWDPVEDTPIGRNERALSIEFITSDLKRAFNAFGVVVSRYYEGKPIVIAIDSDDFGSVLRHHPGMLEIPDNCGIGYKALMGSLDDAKVLIVGAETRFSQIYVLEVPTSSGPVLEGQNKRGCRPTTYSLTHKLIGAEDDVIAYARVLDKALSIK